MRFKQKKTKNLILVSVVLFFTTINFYAEQIIARGSFTPDVAINSSGDAVIAFRTNNDTHSGVLFYNHGKYVSGASLLERKDYNTKYDKGKYPSIAISDDNIVAERHRNTRLHSTMGELDSANGVIDWKEGSTEGYGKKLSMILCSDQKTVVSFSIYGSLKPGGYYRVGTFGEDKIDWENDDHFSISYISYYGAVNIPSINKKAEDDEFIHLCSRSENPTGEPTRYYLYYKLGALKVAEDSDNLEEIDWSDYNIIYFSQDYESWKYYCDLDIVYIPQDNMNVLLFSDVDGLVKYKTSSWKDKVITEDTLSGFKELKSRYTSSSIEAVNWIRAVALPDGTGVLVTYERDDNVYYSICDIY